MSIFFPRVAFGPSGHCAPAIVRHNDFAPLFSLFDDTVNDLARHQRRAGGRCGSKSFAPRFDVKEDKDTYLLEGELPGINQENISIEFTDEHTLTIKGHSERHTKSAAPQPQETTEADTTAEDAVLVETPATDDNASVKSSHQATVEDETTETTTESKGKEVEKPTAEAEAPAAPQAPRERFWFSERRIGTFTRSFSFADRVDQEAVRASLKDGILSIVVPKAPKPESRRINIE